MKPVPTSGSNVMGISLALTAAALVTLGVSGRRGHDSGMRRGARNAARRRELATTTLPASAIPSHEQRLEGQRQSHIDAARAFDRSAALLAFSVLSDSAMEHYRGAFTNPAMFTPLVASTLSLAAGVHGSRDKRARSHWMRDLIYLTAGCVGVAGTGFHLYNIGKRPGGLSWNNLFHAAPLGAPAALMLSGAFGGIAERLRNQPEHAPRLLGMPAGRALSYLASVGLIGTVGEVALLHFRGAYQNPYMFAPVLVPPVAAACLAHAAIRAPSSSSHWLTRLWLRVSALLGFAGVGFHARGIARNHGGWRNWSQNLFNGPPLPAPPSFTALAMAGLAALRLRETDQ
ncbi:MAG: hypothetical protein ACRYG5_15130 [Janthinobacterium lividum]